MRIPLYGIAFLIIVLFQAQSFSQGTGNNKGAAGKPPRSRLTIKSLQNLTFVPDSFYEQVTLKDGWYDVPVEKQNAGDIKYFRYVGQVWVHLDDDTLLDAIVVVADHSTGTGSTTYLIPVLNRNGKPQALMGCALEEECVVEAIVLKGSAFSVAVVVQGPNDPHCCPTKKETWRFMFRDNILQRIR
jgi:hypothetical protein